jgi:tripartite-type tricarboxylate transporter receptor subunit TctC
MRWAFEAHSCRLTEESCDEPSNGNFDCSQHDRGHRSGARRGTKLSHEADPHFLAQAAGGPTDIVTRIYATKLTEVRALGITGVKRVSSLPDVPAIAEVLPGYEATSWYAVLTRAGTPRAIINRLNGVSAQVTHDPEVHSRLVSVSVDPERLTPEQLGAKIRRDYERWGKVVTATGLKKR